MLSAVCMQPIYNPIDVVENMFQGKSVEFERRSSTEVVAEVEGKWDNMLLFFQSAGRETSGLSPDYQCNAW